MTAREKMKQFREMFRPSFRELSRRCGVSEVLLKMVENGEVTHPLIVSKIQKFYELTDEEAEELLPENHRPHSPKYDPDKYVAPVDINYAKCIPRTDEAEKFDYERKYRRELQQTKRSRYYSGRYDA